MILGKITGKVTTTQFSFIVEQEAKNFEYVQANHPTYGWILAQIVELIRDEQKLLAKCNIIGYKEDNKIKSPREPLQIDTEILRAQDQFIQEIIKLETKEGGALVGKIEGRDIPIYLDLQNLLTKHLAVLAKSGAGKSYTVGVLLEEILDKRVPLLIIDPHGEYESLRYKTESDSITLQQYNLKPKSFLKRIHVYGDPNHNENTKPLKISNKLTTQELLNMLPSKLSSAQEGMLYAAIKEMDYFDFDELIFKLEQEESPGKWNVIKMIDYLKNINFFSSSPIPYNELIQGGRCSIINLKGISPEMQEIVVYKLLKDLFEERKKSHIPPFFCVIEEAHNFCPERGFGQTIASQIIRNIASEGRKFGMGLAVISQRPARIDKSVLSQVSTQIILKVTNPNDLKAISNSVEGITTESEKEIQNLAIGQALITGVVDVPLFINVRPRMTKHGGDSVNMLETSQEDKFFKEVKDFEKMDLMPLIQPTITPQDYRMMNDIKEEELEIVIIPAVLFSCKADNEEFNLLLERKDGTLITNVDTFEVGKLPELEQLNDHELQVLKKAFNLQEFTLDQLASFGFQVEDTIKSLMQKEYISFDTEKQKYLIGTTYVLSNLKRFRIFQKIEFHSPHASRKEKANISTDQLKKNLSKFVNIIDLRDCFLIKYQKFDPLK